MVSGEKLSKKSEEESEINCQNENYLKILNSCYKLKQPERDGLLRFEPIDNMVRHIKQSSIK